MAGASCLRRLACIAVLLVSTASAARTVGQASGRHLAQVDCTAGEQACQKVACSGVLKTECDSSNGQVTCTCQSAGLVSCFPGAARVALRGGGARAVADLALGDEVLAVGPDGRLRYSPVAMFTSRRPEERAAFVRVHTDAGLNITVTPGHYLFAWEAAQAPAAYAALLTPSAWPYVLPTQLKVGDLVPVAAAVAAGAAADGGSPALARVTAVERLSAVGVYMPHTLTGAIVVDGVVASELTSLVPPSIAGARFQRGLAAALRLACALLPAPAVEAAARGLSSWVHGTADASVSHAAVAGAAAVWGTGSAHLAAA